MDGPFRKGIQSVHVGADRGVKREKQTLFLFSFENHYLQTERWATDDKGYGPHVDQ